MTAAASMREMSVRNSEIVAAEEATNTKPTVYSFPTSPPATNGTATIK